MADDGGLLAIEVGADDYTDAAAGDSPTVPRTFQSEADFQAQKASYSAKIDTGDNHSKFLLAVPALDGPPDATKEKISLSKKGVQLLGYAVGEMYYDREYEEIVRLCGKVQTRCDVGKIKGLEESLERWEARCRARLER